jgi:hypothetical protein
MGKCKKTNKPTVDETQIECCNIYRSNCVVASEADTYLKYGKGETLTKILKIISDAIKAIRQDLLYVSKRRFMTGLITQVSGDAPTISGVESTLLSNVTYTFSYTATGKYLMTFNQGILNPTTTYATLVTNDVEAYLTSCKVISTTQIEITCLGMSGLSDNLILNTPLMIRI